MILVVETTQPAIVHELAPVAIQAGDLTLHAHSALTSGEMLRYEPQPHKNTLGYWVRREDACQWPLFVREAGRFEVLVWQGCGTDQGGSEVQVTVGEQQLSFTVQETGHFQKFRPVRVGEVELPPGMTTLRIQPTKKANKAVMDVRQVKLVRIEE